MIVSDVAITPAELFQRTTPSPYISWQKFEKRGVRRVQTGRKGEESFPDFRIANREGETLSGSGSLCSLEPDGCEELQRKIA
jgi:hypothetical protein